ncbi:MAG: FkbM family methyltransferase [Planctomycetes bacterium]|nr:FkbM family methyltransferase [Planctomycetota bacterium]
MPNIRGLLQHGVSRLQILRHWVAGRRNGTSLRALLRYLFKGTRSSIGRKYIADSAEEGEFVKVSFVDKAEPLYYPKGLALPMLYEGMADAVSAAGWHNYEHFGTTVTLDDTVVDCGAAEGFFGFWVSGRCKAVYVVEPLPAYVSALRKTFEAIPNGTVIDCALGGEPGTASLEEHGMFSRVVSNRSGGTEVLIETLDRLFFDRGIPVSYIKADVEGYEMQLLHGGRECIREWKPKIAIAAYHEKQHADEIAHFLRSVVPEYKIRVKGIQCITGCPVMLHAWV